MTLLRTLAIAFLLLGQAHGFFAPLSSEERVRKSQIIAVVKAQKFDEKGTWVKAVVLNPLKGTALGATIEITLDSTVAGRDPLLEPGKTYLIYLKKDERGKWVTPQSSLESLAVARGQVEKEGEEGTEPLQDKINRLKKLIASQEPKKEVPAKP